MVRSGTLVVYALLGAVLVLNPTNVAADALPITPPDVPPMPAPPATIGRCLQVGQAFVNSGSSTGEALRTVSLGAVDHQEEQAVDVVTDTSAQADPLLNKTEPVYVGSLTTTNDTANAVFGETAEQTDLLGPALNRSILAASALAIEWVPAAARSANETVPWFGKWYNHTVLSPIRKWNLETNQSKALEVQNHSRFFLGYSQSVVAAGGPPTTALNSALANNMRDLNVIVSSPGGVGGSLVGYTDALAGTGLDAVEAYGAVAAVFLEEDGLQLDPAAMAARLQAMRAAAEGDATLTRVTVSAQAGSLQAAAGAFAAQAPGCARN